MKFTSGSFTACLLATLLISSNASVSMAAYIFAVADVTVPTDSIVPAGVDFGSPGGEEVDKSIDNLLGDLNQYTNLAGAGSGFDVDGFFDTRFVSGISFFTSASDPASDPTSYQLHGSNGGPFILIASGSLSLPAGRNVDNTTEFSQTVFFLNTTPYDVYRVIFPTVNGGPFLQIGEVELIPEPSSLLLAGLGLASVAAFRRRRVQR